MPLVYAKRIEKDLRRLSPELQRRIIDKMAFFAKQTDPLQFAEPLINNPHGNARFRIGDYRAICEIESNLIKVMVIGHRREIYR